MMPPPLPDPPKENGNGSRVEEARRFIQGRQQQGTTGEKQLFETEEEKQKRGILRSLGRGLGRVGRVIVGAPRSEEPVQTPSLPENTPNRRAEPTPMPPVSDKPNTPITGAPTGETLRDALIRTSKQGVGTHSHTIPYTSKGDLACAAMVQGALYATTGKKMGNLNVAGMRNALDKECEGPNAKFERVEIDPNKPLSEQLQPGDIVVSLDKRGGNRDKNDHSMARHGHIGIAGENGTVYSNSSSRRKWEHNFPAGAWERNYGSTFVYRAREGAMATNNMTLAQGVDAVHGTRVAQSMGQSPGNAPAQMANNGQTQRTNPGAVTDISSSPQFGGNNNRAGFQHGAETATQGLTARQKAALDLVAKHEGTFGTYGYYKRVHGGHCESAEGCVTREELNRGREQRYTALVPIGKDATFQKLHPNLQVVEKNGQRYAVVPDTGMGRYQMQYATYKENNYLAADKVPDNLKKFFVPADPKKPNGMMKLRDDLSPEQKSDLTALVLMQKKGALDKFENGDVQGGVGNLKNMWSVAGNAWGHKEASAEEKRAFFEARVAYYEAQERGDKRGMQLAQARTEQLLGRPIKDDPNAEMILAQANNRRADRPNDVQMAANQPAVRPSIGNTTIAQAQNGQTAVPSRPNQQQASLAA
jgi:muramidase (phage lysozyme)